MYRESRGMYKKQYRVIYYVTSNHLHAARYIANSNRKLIYQFIDLWDRFRRQPKKIETERKQNHFGIRNLWAFDF